MSGIFKQKLTGDVRQDIDTIYDTVNYVESLVQGLVREWEGQNLGICSEYLDILALRDKMKSAAHDIHKVRNWYEPKRVYGPLANVC